MLSNMQKELLKLYSTNIPDQQLNDIKLMLGNYFAQEATSQMDNIWDEKGLTNQDMENWTNEHNRRKSSN